MCFSAIHKLEILFEMCKSAIVKDCTGLELSRTSYQDVRQQRLKAQTPHYNVIVSTIATL